MTERDLFNVKHQTSFCTELMMRIDDTIGVSKLSEYDTLDNYTRLQQDIVRLRRELNDLRIMLDPYGKETKK